jgi:TonB-dependent receptor
MKRLIFLVSLSLGFFQTFAGAGQISGKVIDEKGEALMGATIMIEGTALGAKVDMDGKFTIRNVDDGKYNLVCSYVSYEKKTITDVVVKDGKSEFLNVVMLKSGKGLKEVVIKTQMKKESINALQIQQKNLSTISDGISAELIKKTPDRNTGDVLKRVSGVTVADGKFAVIRGLADRYNMAMLNGDILPSSEADRKAFSFDIFPSNLLENITIVKAATPDRPGEFSGGIIDLVTKEIPTESFLNLQIGTGMNTISTFKQYYDSKNSNTDWLGYDKTVRVIPSNFPTKEEMSTLTASEKVDATKLLDNTWGTTYKKSMSPFRNFQLGGGYVKRFKKEMSFGVIGAISYSRTNRTFQVDRNEIIGAEDAYHYHDSVYKDNILIGSLLNFGFKINARNKINFKNSFSITSEDQTVKRNGESVDNEAYIKGSALWFSNNQLLTNQLSSEHIISKRKIKLQLGLTRNAINRTIPDLRKSMYQLRYDATDGIYRANITTAPNPFFMGRYFSTTNEKIYSGKVDVTVPYTLGKYSQSLKVGTYMQSKDRTYDARVLAYVKAKNVISPNLTTLGEGEIFDEANIRTDGFVISDATQLQDHYEATSNLQAYYIMSDNLIANKFRFVYGVRIEDFKQQLVTGNLVAGDFVVDKHNTNFLPSLNFTYLMNKKTNVRFCASQTLSRPEFRELSPAAFYDYNMSATYTGNSNLEQTKIQNYDIRYEYFMGKGEMISGSIFYKRFENAIEMVIPKGTLPSQKNFSYSNAPLATSYGLEVEFRKSLSMFTTKEKSQLNNIVVFGNFSYIKSNVDVNYQTASGENLVYSRPMQGQSPYIINAGIGYTEPKSNFSATVVYNKIGQRIFAVGNQNETPELFEAPRNVIDLSLSKKFYKKFEVKFTISDLLSNPQIFYYNIDENHKIVTNENAFDFTKDYKVIRTKMGTNLGLSVSYQF